MTPESYNVSGIYKIECLQNNKVYIGQSHNIYVRWLVHKSKLKTNSHSNFLLQQDYNKYGENNFKFSILEIADNNLIDLETKWIDFFGGIDNETTYNFLDNTRANNLFSLQLSKSLKGKQRSEQERQRLRTINIGRKMSDHAKSCLIERNHKLKEHCRKINTGKIFITNGIIDKMIKVDDFEKYQNQGFYKGRTKIRWFKLQNNDCQSK